MTTWKKTGRHTYQTIDGNFVLLRRDLPGGADRKDRWQVHKKQDLLNQNGIAILQARSSTEAKEKFAKL